MYGIKIEFTDKTQPEYWIKFQKYVDNASNGDYTRIVAMTYSELQRFGGMINPLYAYRSGVDTLHFMTEDNFNQFVEKWSSYEHSNQP